MKFLVTAQCPTEPFNSLVRNGTAGETIQKIMADIQPESVVFTEIDGMRSAVMVIDMDDASKIPSIAEPFFLNFEAEVHVRVAMTPEDLAKGNLDHLGQKWG